MRRGVALVAVAVLMMTAGCGDPAIRQTAQTVSPSATVTETDGAYEVSISLNSTVASRAGPAPLNVSGTRVVAYDAAGERLCAVETGALPPGGRVTASTTCPDRPAVLVPAAADCDAEVVRRTATVTAISSVRYRATRFTPFRTPSYQPFTDACGEPPARETFVELQCQYFTASIPMPFERRPWTEWERLPPEEDRSFRIRVENRTGGGEISVGPGGPENPDIERPRFTVGADAPPLAGELVALGRQDPISPYHAEVSPAEFFRVYRTLTGYEVNDTGDLPGVGIFDNGTIGVDTDDYPPTAEVQCGGDPDELLTYTGNSGYRTEVHVAGGDGTEWDIQLGYSYRASGPVVANRSTVISGVEPTDTATVTNRSTTAGPTRTNRSATATTTGATTTGTVATPTGTDATAVPTADTGSTDG
jgi:hypothetical protein